MNDNISNFERNEKTELAWKLVEHTDSHVFITGKAGTGKTTFLRRLKERSEKNIVVLAPTGIAALNAKGMTIHSFFQLSFSPFIPGVGQASGGGRFTRLSKAKLKVIRSIDTIVIDEISMVRADILDAIDAKLRQLRNPALPMGGVQLVMIGDVQQLPPVARDDDWELLKQHYRSTYFFDSHLLQQTPYQTVELDKVYRQNDSGFIDILNAIRENRLTQDLLSRLNARYIPGFQPPKGERYIRLMTHNYQAHKLNDRLMASLKTKARTFEAGIEGDFPELMYPAERQLLLKVGAQVMFIKNSTDADRPYYNGLIGWVSEISDSGQVSVKTEEGKSPIAVPLERWENTVYEIDDKDKKMTEKVVGAFTQLPLRAAWAITIHKSQGLTFDKAIINASEAFAHGQTYVALSRCRSLEGLVLEKPLSPSAVICDINVSEFSDRCTESQADEADVARLEEASEGRRILEIADLRPLRDALDTLHRTMQASHGKAYPKLVEEFGRLFAVDFKELHEVAQRFQVQLQRMLAEGAPREGIGVRLKAASEYFLPRLERLADFLKSVPKEVDNKENSSKYTEALTGVEYQWLLKEGWLRLAAAGIPPVREMMRIRNDAASARSEWTKQAAPSKRQPSRNSDVRNPELYDKLREWRRNKAEERGVPAYVIMAERAIIEIANQMPADENDLLAIPGIGKKKKEEFGSELLVMVRKSKD